MCLHDILMSCQNDFPLFLAVTALKYAELFSLCSTNFKLSVMKFMHQGSNLIFTYLADQSIFV